MSVPQLLHLARRGLWLIVLCLLPLAAGSAQAMTLAEALEQTPPAQLFAGADAYGAPQGDPAIVPVLKGGEALGFAYLNSDFTPSTSYSGKPIRIVVGIDAQGVIRGINLVEHHEPIVLIGIPEAKVLAALNGLIGTDLAPVASGAAKPPQAEIVSGATVTVLVMGDSIVRSAVKLIRSGRLDGSAAGDSEAIRRRQNTVLRFGLSSLAVGERFRRAGWSLQSQGLSDDDYALDGGGVPLRIAGAGIVGAMTIAGLDSERNHALVVESLQWHVGRYALAMHA